VLCTFAVSVFDPRQDRPATAHAVRSSNAWKATCSERDVKPVSKFPKRRFGSPAPAASLLQHLTAVDCNAAMVIVLEHSAGADAAIVLPETFTAAWALELARQLDGTTRRGVPLKQVLPPETAALLFSAVTSLLIKEPTLVEVRGSGCRQDPADHHADAGTHYQMLAHTIQHKRQHDWQMRRVQHPNMLLFGRAVHAAGRGGDGHDRRRHARPAARRRRATVRCLFTVLLYLSPLLEVASAPCLKAAGYITQVCLRPQDGGRWLAVGRAAVCLQW